MNTRSMVVSLIGRPNVGKSSLFNAIMRTANKAITHDEPGVTRDRHYGLSTLNELAGDGSDARDIILVDTGGFYPDKVHENGGEEERRKAHFFNIMADHAHQAIDESDLILFVVDVREGALPFDQTIADTLREKKKDFWLVINKYDSEKFVGYEADFYSMGVEPDKMFMTSAAHNLGMDELRRTLHQEALRFEEESLKDVPQLQAGVTPREKVVARLALIGAPNAGKSTMLNQLLGAERALVSNIPGTTVDPIGGFFDLYFGDEAGTLDRPGSSLSDNKVFLDQYEDFRKNNADVFREMVESYSREEGMIDPTLEEEFFEEQMLEDGDDRTNELLGQAFEDDMGEGEDNDEVVFEDLEGEKGSLWRSLHIVDTAGIRRQRAVRGMIETQSVYRALRCITEADIVLFMIDATKGIGHQDRRLIDIALDKGKSVIICLNKIDLLREKLKTAKAKQDWILDLRAEIPWLDYCDLIPVSAKYKQRLGVLRKAIKETVLIRHRRVGTGELNRHVFSLVDKHPIMVQKSKGARLRVKYASMIKSSPPTFLLFTNKSKGIPSNYKKYLQNGLRREFGLVNTPVHLLFRTGTDLERRMKKLR